MSNNPFQSAFDKLNANKYKLRNRSLRDRIKSLSALEKAILKNRQNFREAVFNDFRKPHLETDITELYVVLKEIRYTKARLRSWMLSENIATPLALLGTSAQVIKESKGVCLIIAPWNYPINLCLGPMVSAIAAGNAIVLKPSEHTPHTSAELKKFISANFKENEVMVIEGGKETSEQLLTLPFDHIFFTGSPGIGTLVMESAAKNLTSVTLELGGKSPVYVHHDADIKDAAAKINAAKYVNSGQSCIAPDYVLAHSDIANELADELKIASCRFYDPENVEKNSYASIVNSDQYNRLLMLSGYEETNENNKELRLLPPMIVMDVHPESELMKKEIFGPIMPILKVQSEKEAIEIMQKHHETLAIYIFSRNKKIKETFRKGTSSGSICYNECAVQFLNPALPFGGIHGSGIGRSHGKAGFMTFSNERVVFNQRIGLTTAKLLYPPYSKFKKILVDLLLKYF
ncbi:MAG: aldehyde dehydrogenase family protein [Bacteroidetes bacterium]|nr:aldehyde dehydrogenase family protein [Bacteroidota bacterium]